MGREDLYCVSIAYYFVSFLCTFLHCDLIHPKFPLFSSVFPLTHLILAIIIMPAIIFVSLSC